MKPQYLKIWTMGLVSFFLFCTLAYGETTQPVIKKFKVEDGGTLKLSAKNAMVTIKTTDSDEISVQITWEAIGLNTKKAEKVFKKYKIIFELTNNVLSITSNFNDKRNFLSKLFSQKIKIHFDIKAPNNFNYDIQTSEGKVVIGDVNGDIAIKTSGGRIGLYHVFGSVVGKTSGGSIHVEHCENQLELVTSGGFIHVGRVCGKAKLKTSGGRITVEQAESDIIANTSGGAINVTFLNQPLNDCSLQTSGGSIKVKLAKKLNFNIYAKTSGGKVTTDFPLTLTGELSENEIKSVYNNGGPLLELKTSGGNILLLDL